MTMPDKSLPREEYLEKAREIVTKGPWPDESGAKLYPITDMDIAKQSIPNLVLAVAQALQSLAEEKDRKIKELNHELHKARKAQSKADSSLSTLEARLEVARKAIVDIENDHLEPDKVYAHAVLARQRLLALEKIKESNAK